MCCINWGHLVPEGGVRALRPMGPLIFLSRFGVHKNGVRYFIYDI